MPLPETLLRDSGDLIKSQDWNALIAGVNGIESDLAAEVTRVQQALTDRIDDLEQDLGGRIGVVETNLASVVTTVTQLRSELDAFRAQVTPLLTQFYRVTMETTKVNYAIGELAELTARVTAIDGTPLNLANEAARPWVDFVSTWGRLRAAAGFQSLGGMDDRTISVRVNADGTARAFLRADSVQGLSLEAEEEVAMVLTTRIGPANNTAAEAIMAANTPIEARSVYSVMTREYDRADAQSVKHLVDNYYTKYIAPGRGTVRPQVQATWNEYRTTVMAFAKADSDPRTPDAARGSCSIQVTFRDWIGPWYYLDYTVEVEELVEATRDRFRGRVRTNYPEAVDLVREEVNDLVRDKGVVGKQRGYQVAREALARLDLSNPPAFINTLTKTVGNAIALQQTLEQTAVTPVGVADPSVAFEAFTDVTTRADTGTESVRSEVATLQAQVQERVGELQQTFAGLTNQFSMLQGSIATIDTRVGSIGGRVEAALSEGGALQQLDASVRTVSQQVQTFSQLDPTDVRSKLVALEGLNIRLANLERR